MPTEIQTNFDEAGGLIFKTDYGQYAIFADTERPDDNVDGERYYTLTEAKSEVAKFGGYLAEFTTVEELDAFYQYVKPEIDWMEVNDPEGLALSSTQTPDGGGAAYGWIGANDDGTEGVWTWETSNTSLPNDFGGWGTNEPDDLLFDQDQAAFAFTNWSNGTSFGNGGQINDVDADNVSLVAIAEIPYFYDYGNGRADLTKQWDWDGYEQTNSGIYDNIDDYYSSEDDFSDDYWEEFDPDSGNFIETIPSIENLIKVNSDTSGAILYKGLDGNKHYFANSEGDPILAITESNGEAVWQLSKEWNDGWGSRDNLRAITALETGYLIAIQVEDNHQGNYNPHWRLFELDNTGVINWDTEYWGEIIGYETQFGQDLNGDGSIGFNVDSFESVITDTTGDTLKIDSEGYFYIVPNSGDVLKIVEEWGGFPQLERTETWVGGSDVNQVLAVEYSSTDELYYLARKNTHTNTDSYNGETYTYTNWVVDTVSKSGVYQWGDWGVNIVSYETILNQDLDGDGFLGVDESKLTEVNTDSVGVTLMRGDDVLYINDNGTLEAIRYGGGELADLERHDIHGDHHEFKKTAYAVNKNSDNTFTVIFKIEDKNSIWDNDTQSRSWNTNVSWEIQQLYSDAKFNYDGQGMTQTIDGYETLFNQDLNLDGKIGIDTTNLTDITTDTTGVTLKKSSDGAIFIVDGDEIINVTDPLGGIPTVDVSKDYGDWGYELQAYAIEKDSTDSNNIHYKGLLKHTDWWGGEDLASATEQNNSWEVTKISLQGVLDLSSSVWTESIYKYEAIFDQDFNGDGDKSGEPSSLTSRTTDTIGVATLSQDQEGGLWIIDTSNGGNLKISIKENLEENHEWDSGSNTSIAYAVSKNDSGTIQGFGASGDDYYQVAVQRSNSWTDWQTGEKRSDNGWQIYAIDSSGDINWEKTIWTQSIGDFESSSQDGNGLFQQDLDGDNVVGINTSKLSITESIGDSLLKDSSNNTLYIKDDKNTVDTTDDVTFALKDEWGGNPRFDRTWQNNDGSVGSQSSLSVESYSGGFKLLVKNEGSDSWGSWLNYEILDIDNNGEINWENTNWVEDITSFEKTFNQDFNEDGSIGVNISGLTTASKESVGGDILKSSSDGKFYIYDSSADEHVLIVEDWGGSVNFNYTNTWETGSYVREAVAAEAKTWTDIDGASITGWVVAIKDLNTFEDGGSHTDWQLNYINAEGVIYNELRPRVGSIIDYESDFGVSADLDGDGATGLDLSKLLTVTDKDGNITDTNNDGGDDLLKSLGESLYIIDGDDPSNPIVLVDKYGGTPDFDYTYTRGTPGSSNYVSEESSAYAVESYLNSSGNKEFLLAVKSVETFGSTSKTFWETFQVEKNASTNVWELDWNTSTYSLSIGKKESIFKQDMDGDGVTYDPNNLVLTSLGTDLSTGGGLRAGLSTDSYGALFITYGNDKLAIVDSNDAAVSFDWTNYWGGQIHQSQAYAVEGIDTDSNNKADKYKLAIKHTFTNDSSSQIDNYWQTIEIDKAGRVQWNSETFGQASIQESDLGQDLDGDGIIFSTSTLEYQTIPTDSVGAVPFLDNNKNLYIAATADSTKNAVLDVSGNQLNIDSYSHSFGDYSISQSVIAATEKTISGTDKYQLLIESSETFEGTSTKSYQTINVDQSTYKIDWSSYSNYEDVKKLEKGFEIDLDNDGLIYTVNTNVTTAVDTDIAGAKLRQTEDGSLVVKDGEVSIVLTYSDGGFVDLNETDSWTGGSYKSEAVAVQKVGKNYKIAVKETIISGDNTDILYQVISADSNGVIDWGKSVWQTPEELIESIYDQDIDGDGVISTGTKSSLADTVSKTNINGEVIAEFSNTAQSDFYSITNADTTSNDSIEMFVKGVDGTAKSTYSMEVSVVQEANAAVMGKIGKDTGFDDTKLKALTGVLDFNVTIPDPDNYGKIVSLSWVLPEGTINPKYMKKDAATGEYFDFIYDTETREGALWDASTNTLTVSVRDNGQYDSDSTRGVVRDPAVVTDTSETDSSSSGYDGKQRAFSSDAVITNTGKSYVKTTSSINIDGKDTSVCLYGGELATGSVISVKDLTTAASNNAPTGVTLNDRVLDFTVDTSANDLALTFGTTLVSNSISDSFKENDTRKTNARWSYSAIDSSGNITDLSFDPVKMAGAKFYDLIGNDGIAETIHLKLVDGGYGDKDGIVNGKIVDPSTAGVVTLDASFINRNDGGLQLNDSNNSTLEANHIIKITLNSNSLSSTSDQIGYWVEDNTDTSLTIEVIKTRAKTLFNTLESTDTTAITSASELYTNEIILGNDQHAHFFKVTDGTIADVISLTDSKVDWFSISSVGNDTATLSSNNGIGDIKLTAEEINNDQGLDALIGQYQSIAPVLDLESVPTNLGTISANVEIAREAGIDSSLGFYKILNTDGDVLDPITGDVVTASASNYAEIALGVSNLVTELAGLRADDDSTTSSTIASIDDYSLLAPYATSNDQTFFAFEAANSDGISHIKTLGNNIFGLEDLYGGGDLDYDDIVVRLDFSVG